MLGRRTVLLWTILLAACAQMAPAPSVAPASRPSDFPIELYRSAVARGEPVYLIDTSRSVVVMRVYRGGALSRFGHDHVVASRNVQGYVRRAGPLNAHRADLYAPLDALTVDEPVLRAQAGFDTQPTQQDIEGTKTNMLEKVLEAEKYPFISLRLGEIFGTPPTITANAAITLHGKTVTMPIKMTLDTPSNETLYVHGRFSVKQTDFGIVPYSLLGGALRVEDQVDIAFDLAATRVDVVALR